MPLRLPLGLIPPVPSSLLHVPGAGRAETRRVSPELPHPHCKGEKNQTTLMKTGKEGMDGQMDRWMDGRASNTDQPHQAHRGDFVFLGGPQRWHPYEVPSAFPLGDPLKPPAQPFTPQPLAGSCLRTGCAGLSSWLVFNH